MDKLTTFQKALLDAATEQFCDIPDEDRIDLIPSKNFCHSKRSRFSPVLKRVACTLAVVLLLSGTAFGAYVILHRLGQIEIDKTVFDTNDQYGLRITDDIADQDAPYYIETLYLPELPREQLMDCYIETDSHAFYPLWEDLKMPDLEDIHTVHLDWNTEDNIQITYTQMLARDFSAGDTIVNYGIGSDPNISVSSKMITVDDYEVFSFMIDFSNHPEMKDNENSYNYNWYWTDGSYLYRLSASCGYSEAYLKTLFQGIKKAGTIYEYLNFDS